MQDAEFDDTDALRNLVDERDYFYVIAWNEADAVEGKLTFEQERLHDILQRHFGVRSWHRKETEEFGPSLEYAFPPDDEMRLLSVDLSGAGLIFEGVTPRELYNFLLTFVQTFPQTHKLYVVWGGIGYAWLRTDLPEEDAIIHMLSHDDGVRDVLGLPEYDHSQW